MWWLVTLALLIAPLLTFVDQRPRRRFRYKYIKLFDTQTMMEVYNMEQISSGQQRSFTAKITDKRGREAKVEGAPVWTVSDPTFATVEAEADGMSAVVKPAGVLGVFSLRVTADADLGDGVREISREVELEIVAADAENIEIIPGEATDLP